MTTGRAIHHADDGAETDITAGVQALYDLVINSMDWGSGFWTAEDALPVAQLGRLLGFEKIDEVERYVADRMHETEREAWLRNHPEARPPPSPQSVVSGIGDMQGLLGAGAAPHDHVFSSAGRCMWPRCSTIEEVISSAPPNHKE